MNMCPVCDGDGGWRIPGIRDWGTCATCKGAGELTDMQYQAQLNAERIMAQRDRQLRARVEAGRVPPAPS